MDENMNTEVTVEVDGADELSINVEEPAVVDDSKGGFNFGAFGLACAATGALVYGGLKLRKWWKKRKAAKMGASEDVDELDEFFDDEDDEADEDDSSESKTDEKSSKSV